jgi:hypothetical protein
VTKEPTVSQIARPYWPDHDVRSTIFCARYPDSQELIAKAQETSRGLITFWHPWHMEKTWVPEQLESPIKWDKIRTGDEEWPHALVRLSHLVDLAGGWRLTNERPLADCYWDHVEQFCAARRGTRSHLWSNRLDSALRIFHLIKSFDILRKGDVSTASQSKLLFDHIRFEVDFLLQGLGSKVGNWELIICCAILTASEYLHDQVDSTIWREKASSRLQELLKTEIQPDGHWIEQAPMYHGECIIALADYIVILRTNDLPIPDWLLQAVQTLLVTLEEITDPQGKIPQIGDSDAFETAYISNLCEVLLGEQARGKNAASTQSLVKIYQPTGWAVSKWNDPATGKKYQLLFDASGKPPARRQWHSHADDLQVILTSSEGSILVDPGRFTYSPVLGPSNPTLRRMMQSNGLIRGLYGMFVPQLRELARTDWRNYFSRTAAHNTVSCDGAELHGYGELQSEKPDVRLLTPIVDEKQGTFLLRGQIQLGNDDRPQFRHCRTIIGVPHTLIAVIDHVDSRSAHEWTVSYHLGTGITVDGGQEEYVLKRSDKSLCKISIFNCDKRLNFRVEDDYLSPEYNLRLPSKTIRTTIWHQQSFRMMTLFRLAPLNGSFDSETVDVDLQGWAGKPSDRIKLDSGDRSLIIWHQDEPNKFTDGQFTIENELTIHRT